jgi:hypothetical protein
MENLALNYDKVVRKKIEAETINYGIISGNEKIVFIKVGADGNIKGYKNKYLKMAHRVHEKTGATVICASNPYIENGHVAADKEMILKVVNEMNFSEYTVSFFGTSDGAYHNLSLAQEISGVIKILCVNPSSVNLDDLEKKLLKLSSVNKILVYGSKDDEYSSLLHLKELNCENLELMTIDGADHEFKGMSEEYITLIDML